MPVDWDKFADDVVTANDSAAKRTDDKLANKISKVTRMTDEEVKELFPVPADVKKLADLIKIVNDATDRNTKINNIAENAQEFSGIILTLLQKFM